MEDLVDTGSFSQWVPRPTLVIGLGGAGTAVVRNVKRRFRRTWEEAAAAQKTAQALRGGNQAINNAWEFEDSLAPDVPDPSSAWLPPVEVPGMLQLLAFDTEPLVNPREVEHLHQHEYICLGHFDAARLIAHLSNHPEIKAWWNHDDLPVGFVHVGAGQLRPLGRLALFRHYVTLKEALERKLASIILLRNQEVVQELGMATGAYAPLVVIVSSLCGGTGSGMLLDVAHWVKDRLGANGLVVGILLMPSALQSKARSRLQWARMQANAYATLKEINACQTGTYQFQVRYPSERADIPRTPRRPFDKLFLVEQTARQSGVAEPDDESAQDLAAQVSELISTSRLSEALLGFHAGYLHGAPSSEAAGAKQTVAGETAPATRPLAAYSLLGRSPLPTLSASLVRYCQAALSQVTALRLLLGPDLGSGYTAEIESRVDDSFTQLLYDLRSQFTSLVRAEVSGDAADRRDQARQRLDACLVQGIRNEILKTGLWGAVALTRRISPHSGGGETHPSLSQRGLYDSSLAEPAEVVSDHDGWPALAQGIANTVRRFSRRMRWEEAGQQSDESTGEERKISGALAAELARDLEARAEEIRDQLEKLFDPVRQLYASSQADAQGAISLLDPHHRAPYSLSPRKTYDLDTLEEASGYAQAFWKARAKPVIEDRQILDRLAEVLLSAIWSGSNPNPLCSTAQDLGDRIRIWLLKHAEWYDRISGSVEARSLLTIQWFEEDREPPLFEQEDRLRLLVETVGTSLPEGLPPPQGDHDGPPDGTQLGGRHSSHGVSWVIHNLAPKHIACLSSLHRLYCGTEDMESLHVLPGWQSPKQMPELVEDQDASRPVDETDPQAGATNTSQGSVSTKGSRPGTSRPPA